MPTVVQSVKFKWNFMFMGLCLAPYLRTRGPLGAGEAYLAGDVLERPRPTLLLYGMVGP